MGQNFLFFDFRGSVWVDSMMNKNKNNMTEPKASRFNAATIKRITNRLFPREAKPFSIWAMGYSYRG